MPVASSSPIFSAMLLPTPAWSRASRRRSRRAAQSSSATSIDCAASRRRAAERRPPSRGRARSPSGRRRCRRCGESSWPVKDGGHVEVEQLLVLARVAFDARSRRCPQSHGCLRRRCTPRRWRGVPRPPRRWPNERTGKALASDVRVRCEGGRARAAVRRVTQTAATTSDAGEEQTGHRRSEPSERGLRRADGPAGTGPSCRSRRAARSTRAAMPARAPCPRGPGRAPSPLRACPRRPGCGRRPAG